MRPELDSSGEGSNSCWISRRNGGMGDRTPKMLSLALPAWTSSAVHEVTRWEYESSIPSGRPDLLPRAVSSPSLR